MTIGNKDTHLLESETFPEGMVDDVGRLSGIFRQEDIFSGRVAFIDAGRSDEGVMDDGPARSETTEFLWKEVVGFLLNQ